MEALREQVVERLEFQARSCARIGSALYERLIGVVLLAHTGYHGTSVRWLGGRG